MNRSNLPGFEAACESATTNRWSGGAARLKAAAACSTVSSSGGDRSCVFLSRCTNSCLEVQNHNQYGSKILCLSLA